MVSLTPSPQNTLAFKALWKRLAPSQRGRETPLSVVLHQTAPRTKEGERACSPEGGKESQGDTQWIFTSWLICFSLSLVLFFIQDDEHPDTVIIQDEEHQRS